MMIFSAIARGARLGRYCASAFFTEISTAKLVLPLRFELRFAASETTALSIELRERVQKVKNPPLSPWGQRENRAFACMSG